MSSTQLQVNTTIHFQILGALTQMVSISKIKHITAMDMVIQGLLNQILGFITC